MDKEAGAVKTIILVEDEPDIIAMVSFRLNKKGYKVKSYRDGILGLEMIRKEKPGLVLLDLGIPGMPGYEVCKAIKSGQDTKEIPVIFVTASTDNIEEKCKEAGANDVLIKPFKPEDLFSKVSAFIG